MSKIDFSTRMAHAPDEELIRVAYSDPKDGFVAEAINAAKNELQRRKISTQAVRMIESDIENEKLEYQNRHLAPLTNSQFIIFLIFGIFLTFSIAVAIYFFVKGYDKKGMEALRAIFFSFAMWPMIIVAMAWLFGW